MRRSTKQTALSELVAVCDIIKERADKAAERYDVPAYYSVDADLLKNQCFDASPVRPQASKMAVTTLN